MMIEGAVLVLLLLMVAAAGFLWKISQGPVRLDFAKDYVESALKDEESGYHVKVDAVSLAWPDNKGPILLSLDEVQLYEKDNPNPALTIHKAGLSVSYRFLLLGKIRPVSLILDQPSVTLIRRGGDIDFFLQDIEVAKEAPQPVQKMDIRQEIVRIFEKVADPQFRRGALLEAFRMVRIRDANAVIRDYEQGFSWYLTDLDFILRENDGGINAVFNLDLSEDEVDPAGLQLGITYAREPKTFSVEAELRKVNPILFSKLMPQSMENDRYDLPVSGVITADLDGQLMVQRGSTNLSLSEGSIDMPGQFDAPIALADLELKTTYNQADKTLQIDTFETKINGVAIKGGGRAVFSEQGVIAPLTLNIPVAQLSDVPPLFPAVEKDGDAAEWLIHRMKRGQFHDVTITTDVVAKKSATNEADDDTEAAQQSEGWDITTANTKMGFAFEGVDVNYSDGLMPATNAAGSGTMDFAAERLEINGTANIGEMQSTRAHLLFTDIMVSGGGYANIDFDAEGPLADAFEYISSEQIGMGDSLGINANGIKGNIKMATQIAFPTLKDLPKDEVKVTVDATLTDVTMPGVVEGLDLTGGPYALKVGEGAFTVDGSGKLSGRDITLNWKQYFESAGNPFSSQVKASLLADKELRHHFGVDLDEYISGALPIDLVYTEAGNGTSTIDIKGDLNPMQIHIDPFQYEKPAGVAGDLDLTAHLVKGELKKITGFTLETKDFTINKAALEFGPRGGKKTDLLSGTLPSSTIGRTNMAAEFEITPKNMLKVVAKGPVLDAMPFKKAKEEAGGPPIKATPRDKQQLMMISATADKLITGEEDRSISNAKLYLETNDQGDITRIEMDGRAGQGDVYVRFKPDAAGKRTFRMEAADAGAFLYAVELYDNIRGGNVVVYAEPQGGDLYGDLYGVARIENFRVVKAPALAQLLNGMSLVGLGQLLGNQGLPFTKLEADFEWRFRTGGNILVIKDGRTSGTSLGLTFEGSLDQATEQTNIQGTIIPVSEVNSLLKDIPLVGDILTGGSGLIAATYTMRGPSEAPVVSVNPLSVLAPGIIRKILFEGGYKSTLPDREK